jgi:hypothetical protein
MKAKDLVKFIQERTHPEDEIIFCQNDGSGYTCELAEEPNLVLRKDVGFSLDYWEKSGEKFDFVFGG